MASDNMTPEASSDDRLWAALAYVFTPLVPVILLLLEDKKDQPYIRSHNAQALVWGVLLYVIATVTIPLLGLGVCIGFLGFLLQLYWAYQAYQGMEVTIPVVTDFVKKQGWA